jgi:hypothetical protein
VRLRDFGWDALGAALAIAVTVVMPPRTWVEAHYANGLYPAIDRVVRAATGGVPICVGDVLFALALFALVALWARAVRAPNRRRALGAAALRTLGAACAVYVWFVVSWGYGYRRVPLSAKIVLHDARTNGASVAALGDRVVDELSREAPAAHREVEAAARSAGPFRLGARLEPTFEAAIARLGDRATFAPPRVKPTIFQPFMERSGTSGFTDPWTHEVNVDATASPFERPAIYAHEWAHVAGFNDESEANFISVLACTNARDPLLRYSGWLLVWFNLPGDLRVTHRISRLAYDDLAAIRARYLHQVDRRVEQVQRAAYDGYLKANHVSAGYASYRLFVRWMTGADFDRAGLPRVRPDSTLEHR